MRFKIGAVCVHVPCRLWPPCSTPPTSIPTLSNFSGARLEQNICFRWRNSPPGGKLKIFCQSFFFNSTSYIGGQDNFIFNIVLLDRFEVEVVHSSGKTIREFMYKIFIFFCFQASQIVISAKNHSPKVVDYNIKLPKSFVLTSGKYRECTENE